MAIETPGHAPENLYRQTVLPIITKAQEDLPWVLVPKTPKTRAELATLMHRDDPVYIDPVYTPRLTLSDPSKSESRCIITLCDLFQERDADKNELRLYHRRQIFFAPELMAGLLSTVEPGGTATAEGIGRFGVCADTHADDSRINADRLLNYDDSANFPLSLELSLSKDLRKVTLRFRKGKETGELTFEKKSFLGMTRYSLSARMVSEQPASGEAVAG